jgi:hypothetical protein
MELSTGYSITKVSSDTYTVSVSGGATTGSVSGGGFFRKCWASHSFRVVICLLPLVS